MTLIMRGRRFGFSLEEIRQWLLMYEESGSVQQFETFVENADRQLVVLKKQRLELDDTIEDLQRLRGDVLQLIDDQSKK